MITKPPIDELTRIAGNKYILCTVIAKRAKELYIQQAADEISADIKTISCAANELFNKKIRIVEENY